MPAAPRVEAYRAAALDEARDELLDARIFDRAMAGAGHDDQAAVWKDPAPASKVHGRVEGICAAGQEQSRRTTLRRSASGGTRPLGTTRQARRKSRARAIAARAK